MAYGIDWKNPKYKKLLIAQLEKLSEFYLDNPSIERTTILSRKISSIGYLHEQPKRIARKWCGTGTAMRTYDTDGKRYPCQFFMPMSCGKEKSSKAWEIDILKMKFLRTSGQKMSTLYSSRLLSDIAMVPIIRQQEIYIVKILIYVN